MTYNINADDYMKVRQSRNKTAKMRLYYEFFVQHKFFYNESYLRFMRMLFSWLEYQKEDKYARILFAQMSKYELQLLYCQSLIDDDFHKCLVQAKVDMLLENEFVCII